MLRGIIQHDTLNEVNIRLSDGSKAFDYYGYTNIVFKVLKADGTSYIDSEGENVIATSPEDGIVTVILKGQATAAAGLCQSVIEIYSDEGKMTTARLNYEVFESLDVDEDKIESETEYPALQNLMTDLSALEKSIEAAETARVTAEAARANTASGYVAQAKASAEEAKMWAKASQNVAEGDFATRAELEAVAAGAAPAGYGLGANAPYAVDMNNAVINGWYRCGGSVTKNYPLLFPGAGGAYGVLFVQTRDGSVYQEVRYYNYVAHRYYNGNTGEWSEWEYVNPPMQVGTEYRTTERYMGKPVYTKVLNFGVLPNATEKKLGHGVANIDTLFLFTAVAKSGTESVTVNNAWFVDHCYANASEIAIKTNYDMSLWGNCYCTLKYTKTTDT